MLSPWDGLVNVPELGDKVKSHVVFHMVKRSERQILENGNAIEAITKRILKSELIKSASEVNTEIDRQEVLEEKVLGVDHPSSATTLGNLAELYRQQGRYAVAEPLYQ